MNNLCVILCMYYPYREQECFVHTELSYIAKMFDEVIVIPTGITVEDQQIYDMPANVRCMPIMQPDGKQLKKAAIRALAANLCLFAGQATNKKNDLIYFAKAYMVYEHLKKMFSQKEMVLHNFWFEYTVLASLWYKKNNKSVKVTTQSHRCDLYENRNSYGYLPFRKYMMKKIDGVYPCSDNGTVYLKNKYGKWNSNIRTIYLGTMDPGLHFLEKGNDKEFHIVTCSYLIQIKRIDKMIDALHILEDRCDKKIVWDCFGGGELYDEIKEKVKRQLKTTKANLWGKIKNEELMKYYASHYVDVFVNTSESEGIPVSIMEAMSYQIPIIAPDVGGIREIVDDGVNGFLLSDKCNVAEIADALYKMICMNDMIDFRKKAREKWNNRFNAEKNYKKLAEELKGV